MVEQCSFGAPSVRPAEDDPCWAKIWHSNVLPPKVKTFAWKAVVNGLATEENT
jgi:hypothetical protein